MPKKLIINKLHNSPHTFEVSIILTEKSLDKDWQTDINITINTKSGAVDRSLSLVNIDNPAKVYLLSELFLIAHKVMQGEITDRLVLEEQDIYTPFQFS